MPVIESAGVSRPLSFATAPGSGTSAVQTITIGGTPTGGTFKLRYEGATTAAIAWSATNATLVANIDAALEALATIGVGNVITAVGTAVAGIGTITVTFAGGLANRLVSAITVADNSMAGTAPTVAVAITTPGVNADGLNSPKGQHGVDNSTGIWYSNTGTAASPIWTKIGTQT
jgi:hypothetical protein